MKTTSSTAPSRSAARSLLPSLLLLGLSPAAQAANPDWSDYHSAEEVAAELRQRAAEAPSRVSLHSIGKSPGGRELWLATVAEAGAVPPNERPAIFVGANLAGSSAAGSEAALHLLSTLAKAASKPESDITRLLTEHTFYIAPLLNPDAHAQLFTSPRYRRTGADGRLDRDRDGLVAEDGFDDLDGDGRITQLRIPDPLGAWLPHPEEPRLMVKADAAKSWMGAYRLESEGRDDDGDGAFNEDAPVGPSPDRNFAHAFPHPDPDAGPWPSFTPETKALLDFLLAHKNVALAVVYGPANNLLAIPEPLGPSVDTGAQKYKVPAYIAGFLGLDPEVEHHIDDIWAVAKGLPFIRQRGLTKDQIAQFLGAGPANRLQDEDQALITELAKGYKDRLKAAGLDVERPAAQYGAGGFTPWLYYQYGTLALELDVWGIPKAKKEEAGVGPLTLARLEGMSKDDFLKLGTAPVADLLKRIKAPPQFSAEALIERVKSDQVTPEALTKMAKQMGAKDDAASGKDDAATERQRDVLAWIDANLPAAVAPWTAVTLADGTRAEAGGVDPSVAQNPPPDLLAPAIEAHTREVLEWAGKLARVEIVTLTAKSVGNGVYRVEVVAANRGTFPTHTQMAVKARAHLPVRLELDQGTGVELLSGNHAATSERLEGKIGMFSAEWLVRARPGTQITARVLSDNAGTNTRTLTLPLPQGASR